jgi:hypothetical protein
MAGQSVMVPIESMRDNEYAALTKDVHPSGQLVHRLFLLPTNA